MRDHRKGARRSRLRPPVDSMAPASASSNALQSQGLPEVSSLTIRLQPTQPFFMHVNPNRISILASRQLAQVELHGVERLMDAAVVSNVFQDAVHHSDDAAFASDISRRPRVAPRILRCNDDGIADFKFAVHRFQNFTQSGRTRGISGSGWAISFCLSWNGLKASAAPIRLSTVTSLANSSSDIPSVPAGRFGKTK